MGGVGKMRVGGQQTVSLTLLWPQVTEGSPSEGGDSSLLMLSPGCLEVPQWLL